VRWGGSANVYEIRRVEDQKACEWIGTSWRHFNYLDCIYRRYPETGSAVILNAKDLSRPAKEVESELIEKILAQLKREIFPESKVIAPMGVGQHIDHLLVREVARRLPNQVSYYPDFPYSGKLQNTNQLPIPKNAVPQKIEISHESMRKWAEASAVYRSQMSSFWKSRDDFDRDLEAYASSSIGNTLWSW
jgi:LmbE family N-acetylglucosaminyl deacetylase